MGGSPGLSSDLDGSHDELLVLVYLGLNYCSWQVTDAPLTDEEIDELLTKLTSEEIEKLLEDTDPDDTHMPPSARLKREGRGKSLF